MAVFMVVWGGGSLAEFADRRFVRRLSVKSFLDLITLESDFLFMFL
jgi:hypothetical protein